MIDMSVPTAPAQPSVDDQLTQLACAQTDCLTLHAASDPAIQMSIWTFNTLAALDALIDRTRHKDLIARLEKASREADQLKEDIAFAVATARAEQRQLSKEVGSKVVLPQMTEILRDTVKEARANAAVIEKAEPVKKAKSA